MLGIVEENSDFFSYMSYFKGSPNKCLINWICSLCILQTLTTLQTLPIFIVNKCQTIRGILRLSHQTVIRPNKGHKKFYFFLMCGSKKEILVKTWIRLQVKHQVYISKKV